MDLAYEQFETHLVRGNLAQAEALARGFAAKYPLDERAHVAVARVEAARGRLQMAIGILEKMDPISLGLPHALAHLSACLLAAGNVERARECATRSVMLDEIPAALRVLGTLAMSDGKPEEAVNRFGALVKIAPTEIDAWNLLAEALRRTKRWAAAVQALEHVVAAKRNDVQAWTDLAKARVDAGDVEGARATVVEALTVIPRQPDLLKLANHIRQLGTTTSDPLAKEIAAVRELLDVGDRAGAETRLATLLRLHRPTRALKFVKAELEAAQVGADVSQMVINVMNLAKQYTEAWEPRALLAELLLRPGMMMNVRQAVTHAEEAWNMSGGNPRVGVTLVKAYRATNKLALAQALGNQLRNMGPVISSRVDKALA